MVVNGGWRTCRLSLSGNQTGHKRESRSSDNKIQIIFSMQIHKAAIASPVEMCWWCFGVCGWWCLIILTQSLFHFLIHSKRRSVQLWFLTTMIMVETLQNWTKLSFKQFSLSWAVAVSQKMLSLVGIDSWHWIDCHIHSPSPHWGDLPLHENCRKAWAECFKGGSVAAHRDTR